MNKYEVIKQYITERKRIKSNEQQIESSIYHLYEMLSVNLTWSIYRTFEVDISDIKNASLMVYLQKHLRLISVTLRSFFKENVVEESRKGA